MSSTCTSGLHGAVALDDFAGGERDADQVVHHDIGAQPGRCAVSRSVSQKVGLNESSASFATSASTRTLDCRRPDR
jgi:hypothetical protein